ncbi:hypothetical protein [Burkholderia sp. USMB20]|uniref:hypothetical protein n=1 Tax=Burkholderia sp. USMB20 TaxID=1571773 RepID=UPI0010926DA9|nr:hypothetical protein [Burkholderia sp. USMB20]TGN97216.1 hypothetical protein PL79_011650 [Burkholderia sp. USMB20]
MAKYSIRVGWKRLAEERYHKALFDHLKNSTLVVALAVAAAKVFSAHVASIITVTGKGLAVLLATALFIGFFSLLWYNTWYYIRQVLFPQLAIEQTRPVVKMRIRLKMGARRPLYRRLVTWLQRYRSHLAITAFITALWGSEVYAFFSSMDHLGSSEASAPAGARETTDQLHEEPSSSYGGKTRPFPSQNRLSINSIRC